jgi:hypothetical protein
MAALLLVVAYRLAPVEFEAWYYTAPLPVEAEPVRIGKQATIDRPKRHILGRKMCYLLSRSYNWDRV